MFNRRTFAALAVCLAVSASSAFAGNNGGTKKDSTLRVKNHSSHTLYVFTDVSQNAINGAIQNGGGNAQATLNNFNNLGGKQVAVGGKADFKVKGGNHQLTVLDIENQQQVFADRSVYVNKGETATISVDDADIPVVTGAQ